MVTMLVESGMYNKEAKEGFLNSIKNDEMRDKVYYSFLKSSIVEKKKDKDIYEMSLEELGGVAQNLSCSSSSSLYQYVLMFEKYLDWAYKNGLRKSNINPLTFTDKVEWSKQYVAEYKNSYFTREKVLDMTRELVNPIDRALLVALFEGIKGDGFSELFNLEIEDMLEHNGEYTVLLENKNADTRTLTISQELVKFLQDTANKEYYINKNGEVSEHLRWSKSWFEDSDKIFRGVRRGKQGGEKTTFYVNRKFQLFKEVFNLPFLKTTNITHSGMMHMANQLQVSGMLDIEDLELIRERYAVPNIRVVKEILQVNGFKELYGYDLLF